jgi:hypothetical protein
VAVFWDESMTEISYFWDNLPTATGDYKASYTDDELSLALLLLFNYDRATALIAFEDYASYSDPVDWTATDFRLFACVALVDGRVYENDATLTLTPASGDGYYAVVLRRDDSGGAGDQTVRAALLFNAVAAPTPTQTALTWECVLAQGQVIAGVPQIDTYHWRPLPQNMVFPFRMGDDQSNWSTPGTEVFMIEKPVFQAGVIAHTPTAAITTFTVAFPERFKQGTIPLVFTTFVNLTGSVPTHDTLPRITNISEAGFSLTVDLDTNIFAVNWIAVGPDDDIRI